MVQSTKQQQDEEQKDWDRTINYASFRTDKEPTAGYSAELISDLVKPEYYDRMNEVPLTGHSPDLDTFLKLFKRNVRERANEPFLGTRMQIEDSADGKAQFGEYEWRTWG